MVYCVYSLESPLWGDSDVNTQHIFIWKKIGKISRFCLLIRRYEHSLARTIPVSNIFSWSQRCSSHWSSTVVCTAMMYGDAFYARYSKMFHRSEKQMGAHKIISTVKLARRNMCLFPYDRTEDTSEDNGNLSLRETKLLVDPRFVLQNTSVVRSSLLKHLLFYMIPDSSLCNWSEK